MFRNFVKNCGEVEIIKSKRRFVFDSRWVGKRDVRKLLKMLGQKKLAVLDGTKIDDIQLRLKEAFEFGWTSKEEVRQLEQDLDRAWGEEEVF
ncbi:hypothetical protein LIER_29625 [Lithospermum erythrorhizon]|uniref:Uncharacterized protein n=1 Tax=Lithospermum erythrorhizon TaxID=34254 RepID=A0AAV3RNA7_LITER